MKKIVQIIMVIILSQIGLISSARAIEITAINFNGDLIGKVIADGKVVSYENEVIGNVTADSLIVNSSGELIGGVVPQGIAIGTDNRLLGKVNNDGTVRLASGKIIGKALPSGLVVDEQYKVIGGILFSGLVYDDDGKVVGRLTGDGQYMDLQGQRAGFVSADGYAYRQQGGETKLEGRLISSKMIISETGKFIGSIVPGGKITDFEGKMIGYIHANGLAYAEDGSIIGRIVKSGYAFDDKGNYLGYVSYNGEVINKDKIVGYQQIDGRIGDKDGNIIGYSVDMSATINDADGKYVGRLMPEGKIALARDIIGQLGVRGQAKDKDGKFIGQVSIAGPLMDYQGKVIGQALKNGQVISLEGAPLGFMNFDKGYNNAGRLIGQVLTYHQAYDLNNKPLGVAGISGKINIGETQAQVSPQGYVYNSDGSIGGRLLADSGIYGINGVRAGLINANGAIMSNGALFDGQMTQGGIALRSNGTLFGGTVSANQALTFVGNSLGQIGNNNEVLDDKGAIIAKILPDYSVVSTNDMTSTNLMPKVGQGLQEDIALDFSGNLLGYVTTQGRVRDLSLSVIGQSNSEGQVVDNNGVLVGGLVKYSGIVDDKCQSLGSIDTTGAVKNARNVKIGRILLNNQAVDESGTYLGHSNTSGIVMGNDRLLGTITATGNVLDSENKSLGCIDRQGRLYAQNGALIGQKLTYHSVMSYNNKIIGRDILDGTVVNDKNQIIGRVLPNDRITSDNKTIGILLKYKYAFDKDNKYIGRVSPEGKVINSEDKEIGLVTSQGYVNNEQGQTIGFALYDMYVYDNDNKVKGIITTGGEVKSIDGAQVGEIKQGFWVNSKGEVIARGQRDYYVTDENNNVLGELKLNGDFVSQNGEVIGRLGEDGNIFDKDNNKIATANSLQYYNPNLDKERVYDANGNVIGYKDKDNQIVDENGNIIGYVDSDGMVVDENGAVIGGTSRNWYTKEKRPQTSKDLPEIGEYKKKMDDKDISYKKETLNSINIALSPDGKYLGDILEDGTVVDENGKVIGKVTNDGYVVDNNGDFIGTKSPKNMYIPQVPISPEAYVSGNRRINLGPGGGSGPGERYDPQRAAALAAAQNVRRSNIQVGHVGSSIKPENFDGYQKNWDNEGIAKAVSSWRVDMSEMIFADKPIPAVIARSIDSNNPTPVTAYVERNVYAEEGRKVIIPAGSRMIGTINSLTGATETTSTSARVQITWERLIRPDGMLFVFQGITGDAMGRGGALGYLDQQLFKKYTLPVMTTALTSYAAYLMAPKDNNNNEVETPRQQAANDARENFLEQMNEVFSQILEDKSNIQPLTYVPAGTRIIVYPNVDLWLRNADTEDDTNDLNRRDLLIDDKELERESAKNQNINNSPYNSNTQSSDVLYQSGQDTTPRLLNDTVPNNNAGGNNINGAVPPPPPSSIGTTPSTPITTTTSPKPGVEGGSDSESAPETDDSVVKLI